MKRIKGKAVYNNAEPMQINPGLTLPAFAPIAGVDVKVIGLDENNNIVYQKLIRTDMFGNYDTGYEVPPGIFNLRIGGLRCEPDAPDLNIPEHFHWRPPSEADITHAQNLLNSGNVPQMVKRCMNVTREGGAGFKQEDINQVWEWHNNNNYPEWIKRIVGGEQKVEIGFSQQIYGIDVKFMLQCHSLGEL